MSDGPYTIIALLIILDGLFLLGAIHLWAIKQYRK